MINNYKILNGPHEGQFICFHGRKHVTTKGVYEVAVNTESEDLEFACKFRPFPVEVNVPPRMRAT